MKNKRYTRWTEKESAFLAKWYGKVSIDRIAERIGRPVIACNDKAFRLGLCKSRLV